MAQRETMREVLLRWRALADSGLDAGAIEIAERRRMGDRAWQAVINDILATTNALDWAVPDSLDDQLDQDNIRWVENHMLRRVGSTRETQRHMRALADQREGKGRTARVLPLTVACGVHPTASASAGHVSRSAQHVKTPGLDAQARCDQLRNLGALDSTPIRSRGKGRGKGSKARRRAARGFPRLLALLHRAGTR